MSESVDRGVDPKASSNTSKRRLTAEQVAEINRGRHLLHSFFSVLRTAAYHDANNLALSEPSEKFAAVIDDFMKSEQGSLKIEVGDGQMFTNNVRVRPSDRQRPAIDGLARFFRRRGIGGLLFIKAMDAETARRALKVVVGFSKPLEAEDGVAALVEELKEADFGHLLTPLPPVVSRVKGAREEVEKQLGEVGQLAVQLSKGVAMVKASVEEDDSDVARAGTRHVVRQITDLDPEVRDAVVGLAMLGSSDDMSMRSLTVLLVAVSIAEELGADRALKADLGQACIELAEWDRMMIGGVSDAKRASTGAHALNWLVQQRNWTISDVRQGLALASRYMPPAQATPIGRILRVACDYVDLTTPSPLRDAEPFLKGAPLPPHEVLHRMHKQIGVRYSVVVLKALVEGLGVLPVGTPIELADGTGAVVTGRTEDPMVFEVQDTLSRQKRQASLRPGPGQIVRVITGGDLLKVRSHFILGDDFDNLQKISGHLHEEAENT